MTAQSSDSRHAMPPRSLSPRRRRRLAGAGARAWLAAWRRARRVPWTRDGLRKFPIAGAGDRIVTTASNVVHALRGKWFPRDRYGIARCPVHDDRNPSLSIKDGDKTLLVKCHAGCDPRDILDALRQRGILDEPQRRRPVRQPTRPAPQQTNNDDDRTAYALKIWREAIDARGSPAWTYLFRRGVDLGALPHDTSHVLRWHPHCPWESGQHGCMLALFTDAITGEPRAIHRTAITAAGAKIDRKALGPVKGCVIRLWPDELVTHGLVISEGIETALVAATRIVHRGYVAAAGMGLRLRRQSQGLSRSRRHRCPDNPRRP